MAHIYLDDPKQKKEALKNLKKNSGAFRVVDPADLSYYKDLSKHADRIGDILILADLGYYLVDDQSILEVVARRMRIDNSDFRGEHGFSPEYEEMHGIFYANGPQIKSGTQIDSFENIHIYPLVCRILGLPIPMEIDGRLEVLAPILKD